MRRLLTILVLIPGLALPVSADTIEERIAAELRAQGYEIIEASRTWLGRLRVVAENDAVRREIVINPSTGEILRDYSVQMTDSEQGEHRRDGASKPPRAVRVPVVPAPATTIPDTLNADMAGAIAGGTVAVVDDPEPVPGVEPEVDSIAAAPPEPEKAVLVPLLPVPLLPATPPTTDE